MFLYCLLKSILILYFNVIFIFKHHAILTSKSRNVSIIFKSFNEPLGGIMRAGNLKSKVILLLMQLLHFLGQIHFSLIH